MNSGSSSYISLEQELIQELVLSPEEFDALFNLQSKILELIAKDTNLQTILDEICKLGEALLSNSIASIMLVDQATGLLNVISAPSVPQVGVDALQCLKPGPHGGSCGNAVFHNEPTFVYDTFCSDKWLDLRQLAYDFNLKACWSMPIRDENLNAIGSFALSSFENRLPSPFHKRLLEIGSFLVSIVLRRETQANTIREKQKRLELSDLAIQTAFDVIVMTDAENKIIMMNKAGEKIYGYSQDDVIGKNPKLFSSGLHDEAFFKIMWNSICSVGGWSGEIWNKRANGEIFPQQMSISAIDDGLQKNYLAVCMDLTHIKKQEEQLRHVAYHDSLTKLYNSAKLQELLADKRSKNSGSLLLINIDNFSAINSAYGFEFGNKLLGLVANELVALFGKNFCFRLHGDEFAIFDNSNIDIDRWICEIKKYFSEKSIIVSDVAVHISFSMGGDSASSDMFRNADTALRKAKRQGSNQYALYNDVEDLAHRNRQEEFIKSSAILYNALSSSLLLPYFQGIRDNRSGKITKFEALARITHNGSVLSPIVFLGPAKLAGLLPEITNIMVDKSFAIMQNNSFSFSINLTETDLARSDLVEFLLQKCIDYNIEPWRVTFEILEGVSSEGKQSHHSQLAALKEAKFKLALDDFGAEYSNFERVIDLEIDFIKIDAKYIKNIDVDPKSRAIVEAMSFFAKKANIPCIAEFVHSEAVQKVVNDIGIEYSQGFHFSTPSAWTNQVA